MVKQVLKSPERVDHARHHCGRQPVLAIFRLAGSPDEVVVGEEHGAGGERGYDPIRAEADPLRQVVGLLRHQDAGRSPVFCRISRPARPVRAEKQQNNRLQCAVIS